MPRRSRSDENAAPGFGRVVVLPIVLAILAAAAVLCVGLFWAADATNEISAQRQARMVRQALDASVDQLAQNQEIVAVWDDTYDQMLRGAPDVEWLDDNVGVWLHNAYGHDHVYLLDPAGRPLYGVVDGVRRAPTAYRSVEAVTTPLIAELRSGKSVAGHRHDRVDGLSTATLLPSGIRMPQGAIHISHLGIVGGRPAAISVMAVVPNSEERAIPRRGEQGYLVSIRFLGQNFLDELGRRNLLEGVHFMTQRREMPGYRSIPVDGESGAVIGYIMWKPDLPGRYILSRVTPIVVGCFILTVIILNLLIGSLRRAGIRLHRTLAELRTSEAQALHLAFHDPLTTLANRARLNTALESCLPIEEGRMPALALLDLDRFKQVNDTLGHGAGDLLLIQIGERLCAICPEECVVARLGGDEFAILFPDAPEDEAMRTLCEELVGAVRRPIDLHGSIASVGASIGVAFAEPGVDSTELMRRADIALFRTKAEGKNGFRFFQPAMDAHIRRRAAIESDLRRALIMGEELTVHYQPVLAARTGEVKGLEALVRWHHPVHGLIGPDQFIPVAEEVGLIVPLGEWVFREVCAASKRWPDLYFAVNLSPLQFADEGPSQRLLTIAREEQVDPRRMELEITEGVLMADYPAVDQALQDLREAGFSIALDDFGTGYSSLGYLRRLKVDKIKIDRSFVSHVGEDADSASIVAAIVSLGHSMGLRITAEGVDTFEQKRFLTLAGCDELQGFLFSRALPESEVGAFLSGPPPITLTAA